MTFIPKVVGESELSKLLSQCGLHRIHQGKVRDTYELPGFPDKLLVVASDRISIFDFVLPFLIKGKGEILTAMTAFWLDDVLHGINHHMVAYSASIDTYLPRPLKNRTFLQRHALVVNRLDMLKIECIARGYLTGTGWQAYQQTGEVCGHVLPRGLFDGSKLANPIFTPTDKKDEGHDEHVLAASVDTRFAALTLDIFSRASDYALDRGVVIADTKFEFDLFGTLADEVLSPDSSRFWDKQAYDEAAREKRSPAGYDKELMRAWGKTLQTPFDVVGIHKLDPTSPEHVAWVSSLSSEGAPINLTLTRYIEIFERLVGFTLRNYQAGPMLIED